MRNYYRIDYICTKKKNVYFMYKADDQDRHWRVDKNENKTIANWKDTHTHTMIKQEKW